MEKHHYSEEYQRGLLPLEEKLDIIFEEKEKEYLLNKRNELISKCTPPHTTTDKKTTKQVRII